MSESGGYIMQTWNNKTWISFGPVQMPHQWRKLVQVDLGSQKPPASTNQWSLSLPNTDLVQIDLDGHTCERPSIWLYPLQNLKQV